MTKELALVALLVGFPLNLFTAVKLVRLARRSPRNVVLRERAIMAIDLLALATVFALVFILNDQPKQILPVELGRYITRITLVIATIIPPLYWIRLYWKRP